MFAAQSLSEQPYLSDYFSLCELSAVTGVINNSIIILILVAAINRPNDFMNWNVSSKQRINQVGSSKAGYN